MMDQHGGYLYVLRMRFGMWNISLFFYKIKRSTPSWRYILTFFLQAALVLFQLHLRFTHIHSLILRFLAVPSRQTKPPVHPLHHHEVLFRNSPRRHVRHRGSGSPVPPVSRPCQHPEVSSVQPCPQRRQWRRITWIWRPGGQQQQHCQQQAHCHRHCL